MDDFLQEEFQILSRLAETDKVLLSDLNRELVYALKAKKLVSLSLRLQPRPGRAARNIWYVRITELGRAVLHNHQLALEQALNEEQERQAKEDARRREEDAHAREKDRQQRRHDYLVAAFQVILGIILGAILEHRANVIALIERLFQH